MLDQGSVQGVQIYHKQEEVQGNPCFPLFGSMSKQHGGQSQISYITPSVKFLRPTWLSIDSFYESHIYAEIAQECLSTYEGFVEITTWLYFF